MGAIPGGIQLLPQLHVEIDKAYPGALPWYAANFKSTRCGYVHTPVCETNDADFTEYHQDVAEHPDTHVPFIFHNTSILTDLSGHTYARNENSWAMSINGWAGDSPTNFTTNMPDSAMIWLAFSQLADNCILLNQPVGNLMTHAEAAHELDGYAQYGGKYGPGDPDFERWDWFCLVNPIAAAPPKVVRVSGLVFLKPAYENGACIWSTSADGKWIQFGHWMRSEVLKLILQRTVKKWKK